MEKWVIVLEWNYKEWRIDTLPPYHVQGYGPLPQKEASTLDRAARRTSQYDLIEIRTYGTAAEYMAEMDRLQKAGAEIEIFVK